MRRVLSVAAIAASSLCLAGGATALAGDDPPGYNGDDNAVVSPVTDTGRAENFIRAYLARNVRRIVSDNISTNNGRVRLLNAEARCLEHPLLARRFGCLFTLRAEVRDDSVRGRDSRRHTKGHDPRPTPTTRTREVACLGALRLRADNSSTRPAVQIAFSDCVRSRRSSDD